MCKKKIKNEKILENMGEWKKIKKKKSQCICKYREQVPILILKNRTLSTSVSTNLYNE